uniref:PDZ domain-containing protein n=1 Tax=Zooxanthella nutricula TaxID=1333877 RepID=A0A7S2QA70_9DINO
MGNACCSNEDRGEKVQQSTLVPAPEPAAPQVEAPRKVQQYEPRSLAQAPQVLAAAPAPAMAPTPAPVLAPVQVPATARLPKKGPEELQVEFMTPEGCKTVTLRHRPLGIDFNKTNPIKMKRVQAGSEGDLVGIQEGWQVVGINGEDVAVQDFDYTYALLRKMSERLPMR